MARTITVFSLASDVLAGSAASDRFTNWPYSTECKSFEQALFLPLLAIPMPAQGRSGKVLLNEKGRPIGLQGNIRDISERLQAEQALRESEAQNRAILEAIPDLMFLISRDGEFLSYKAAVKDLYADPAQFLNKNIYDVLPKELAELTMHYIQRSLESGKTQIFEYQLPMGGKQLDWETRMVNAGRDTVMTIIRDITERKQSEEALQESEEKYRNLIQQSNDAIYLLYNKNFEIINEKFQEIFGLSLEEVNKPEFSPTINWACPAG